MLKHLSKKQILTTAGLLAFLAPLFSGCAADSHNSNDGAPGGQDELSAAPANVDALTTEDSTLGEAVAQGEKLATSADLNLRSGPSAHDAIVAVIPEGAEVTVESAAPSKGFYQIKFDDHTGWASSLFLVKPSSGEGAIASDAEMSSNAAQTNPAVNRALQWVHVKMPYCQAANGDWDGFCKDTCRRNGAANKPEWNKYRSDCSGLVSFAWGLPAPGPNTSHMAPFDGTHSYVISPRSLKPGDALNSVPSDHVMLFAGWVNQAKGQARVIQEWNCGQVASEMVLTFTSPDGHYLNTAMWVPSHFLPIRKR